MKEEKKSNQQIYRVRVYKDFDYPSFSIDKNRTLEDVTYRSMEDMKENQNSENYFKVEIINVLPFSLDTEINESTGNTDYDFLIKEIALENTRQKYGEIDYEKNPTIFRKTKDDNVSITFRLREDIEHFYVMESQKYYDLIRNKTIRK